MDELLAFLQTLHTGDGVLQGIFLGVGQSAVSFLAPHQRAQASYPRIIRRGKEGVQLEYGEDVNPEFFEGQVNIEIVTRKSDADPLYIQTMWNIANRSRDLMLGNATQGLVGVKGRVVGPNWRIDRWKQITPSGDIEGVDDPTISRHQRTIDVLLHRTTP